MNAGYEHGENHRAFVKVPKRRVVSVVSLIMPLIGGTVGRFLQMVELPGRNREVLLYSGPALSLFHSLQRNHADESVCTAGAMYSWMSTQPKSSSV